MASQFWNNGWLFNQRLASSRDVLFRTTFAPANHTGAGPVSFNSYFFGPASTGSISGNAAISVGSNATLTSTGAYNPQQHLWNNSWLLNPRLGSCPDWLLRQVYFPANINEIGVTAFPEYYFGVASGVLAGNTAITFTESATLTASIAVQGSATLDTSAHGSEVVSSVGSATVDLRASGSVHLTSSGSATIDLSAKGLATIPSSGSATLHLAASGANTSLNAGSASLDLAAHGSARVLSTGSATIDLHALGTQSVVAVVNSNGSASLGLPAQGICSIDSAGSAAIALGGNGSERFISSIILGCLAVAPLALGGLVGFVSLGAIDVPATIELGAQSTDEIFASTITRGPPLGVQG